MFMEPMQGKWASSQFDFGYTELFCVPGLTSVFFSSCDSVVADSLEFNHIEALYVFDGKTQLLWTQCRGIGPHLTERRKSHGFSPVSAGTLVSSQVMAGCPFKTGVCSVKSGHMSRYEGQLKNVY